MPRGVVAEDEDEHGDLHLHVYEHELLARRRMAALNNACWCAAVCDCHGDPGRILDGLWLHVGAVPRFYPNGVTLDDRAAVVLPRLRELWDARRSGWSVKDSFASLDLRAYGARLLFEAEWLWLSASLAAVSGRTELFASRVWQAAELEAWQRAFCDANGHELLPRVFLPALLQDDDVAVLRFQLGDSLLAGAIAYRAAGVVGLSNVFAPEHELERAHRAAVHAAARCFPGLPLVSYAHADALIAARAAGFESIGPLRVWIAPG